jgi:hypothetical protein
MAVQLNDILASVGAGLFKSGDKAAVDGSACVTEYTVRNDSRQWQ